MLFPSISHGFPSVLPSVHLVLLPYRSFSTELSTSYFPRFPVRPPCQSSLPHHSFLTELSQSYFSRFPSVHPVVASVSLLPNGSVPKLFPTVFRPPCRRFRLAPSARSSPQAISHGFPSSTVWSLPSRSFPTRLSPSYFT